jgi:hypothetical protein
MRKITTIPHTIFQLQQQLQNLFGTMNFSISYQDQEGDLVTITTTEEL